MPVDLLGGAASGMSATGTPEAPVVLLLGRASSGSLADGPLYVVTALAGRAASGSGHRAVIGALVDFRARATSGTYARGEVPALRPDYLTLLQQLLPSGLAWTRESGAELTGLLRGLSVEIERVHARAQKLLDEADPAQTHELLSDWERLAGLPTSFADPQTLEGRRAALVTKLGFRGDQSRAAYIAAAELLGYSIDVIEYRPFSCLSTCTDSISQGDWVFAWTVVTTHGADDALLEGVIRSRAALHTIVHFSYE